VTSLEGGIAVGLAARLGVPIEIGAAPPRGGLAVLEALRNELLVGEADEHEWCLLAGAALAARGGLNFDGIAGDTLLANPFYHVPLHHAAQWADATALAQALVPFSIADYVARRIRRRLEAPLRERVRNEMDRLPENPNRLSFFLLEGRTARVVSLAPEVLLASHTMSVYPYMSRELMQEALMLDPFWKKAVGFHRLGIDQAFPALVDVPSTHDQAGNIDPSWFMPLSSGWAEVTHPSRERAQCGALLKQLADQPRGLGALSGKGWLAVTAVVVGNFRPLTPLGQRAHWLARPLARLMHYIADAE
jgi:hypothetical protein